jgi:hypothetical protein
MRSLVFFLEEPSAQRLLEGFMPRLIETVEGDRPDVRYVVFEGKQDLEKQITGRLRAWKLPGARFVVMRDQDSGDCHVVKARLRPRVERAGKSDVVVVRVACRELEAWVLGDWDAVALAYERPDLAANAMKPRFRNPDAIVRPVGALQREVPDYQKLDGARRVGPHISVDRNRSRSFQVFCAGVLKVLAE